MTSICEGNHAKLKKELRAANLNVYGVYNGLKRFWQSESRNYENTMAEARMRRPNRTFHSLYEGLITYVTPEALHRIGSQSDLSNRPDTDCKGQWQQSQGLPCRHAIKKMRENGQSIPLSAVDRHWHWNRDVSEDIAQSLLLREPATIERQQHRNIPFRTPAGGGISGIRRNPSGFELSIPGSSLNSPASTQRLEVFIAPRQTAEATEAATTTQTTRTRRRRRTIRKQATNGKSQLEEILEKVTKLDHRIDSIQNERSEWISPPRQRYSPPGEPDIEDDLISDTWSVRSASNNLTSQRQLETKTSETAHKQQNEELNRMLKESRHHLDENDTSSSNDKLYQRCQARLKATEGLDHGETDPLFLKKLGYGVSSFNSAQQQYQQSKATVWKQ